MDAAGRGAAGARGGLSRSTAQGCGEEASALRGSWGFVTPSCQRSSSACQHCCRVTGKRSVRSSTKSSGMCQAKG